MRYFIKNPTTNDVDGPFSTGQLTAMISQAEISSDFLATSDMGESLDAIKKQKGSDWFSLANILGSPNPNQISEFEACSKAKTNCLMAGALCFGIPHLLFVVGMGLTKSLGMFLVFWIDLPLTLFLNGQNWIMESRIAWFIIFGGFGSLMYAFVGAVLFSIFSRVSERGK